MITPRISKSKAASLCANTLSISLRRENLRRLKRIRRVLTLAFENSALGFEQLLFNVPAIRQRLSKWFSLPLPPAKFPLNKITFHERRRGSISYLISSLKKINEMYAAIFQGKFSKNSAFFFLLILIESSYRRKIRNVFNENYVFNRF